MIVDAGGGFDRAVLNGLNVSIAVGGWTGIERIVGFTGDDTIDATGGAAGLTLTGGAGADAGPKVKPSKALAGEAELADRKGYRISNVDVTLICELPKIGPHAEAMMAELARILRIDASRVSVKATTSEKLGFAGRGEGIAAMASATLVSK